uniref:Uncharacterized protein n=1 Tax=Arundo donax TaxID=35708 RepID=A0A0A9G0I0_ARUDO
MSPDHGFSYRRKPLGNRGFQENQDDSILYPLGFLVDFYIVYYSSIGFLWFTGRVSSILKMWLSFQ